MRLSLVLFLPLLLLPVAAEPEPPTEPQFDLFGSIAALSHLQKVASVASTLNTLLEDDSPPAERILHAADTLASPALRSSISHITSHLDKLLVPEVIDTAVTLLNVTPLLSDAKRTRVVAVLDALRVFLTPKFAADWRRARDRFDALGLDLSSIYSSFNFRSYFDYVSSGFQWYTRFTDPEFRRKLALLAEQARVLLDSDTAQSLLASATDKETLEALLSILERTRAALTPSRLSRIRALASTVGLVGMDDPQARARFGETLAEWLRSLTTEDAQHAFQDKLARAELLLLATNTNPPPPGHDATCHPLDDLSGLLQLRALLTTPYLAPEIHTWCHQTETVVGHTLPAILALAGEVVATLAPLRDPVGRAERVLEGPLAEDLGRVAGALAAVSLVSVSGVEVQRWVETTLGLLEAERVGAVRLLVADVVETLAMPQILIREVGLGAGVGVGFAANRTTSAGMDMNILGMPLLTPPEALDTVLALLDGLDGMLLPGEVERTRQKVAALAAVVEVVVEVADQGYEFHDEL